MQKNIEEMRAQGHGYDSLPSKTALPIFHKGPSLAQGALPTLFYFAMTGKESLTLPPYNQPVALLAHHPIRIFSFTIPGHNPECNPSEVMQFWANEISCNRNPIAEFLDNACRNIAMLIESGYIDPNHMAAAGLSRGGFIATHLAAKEPRIKTLFAYAPLTQLDLLDEFKEMRHHPLVQHLALPTLAEQLIRTRVRFYIGNRDLRVGTQECFHFIKALADTAYAKGVRSPQAEIVVTPSIGHKGHGTSPQVFLDGINWLTEKFGKDNL